MTSQQRHQLLVASNRGPVTFRVGDRGDLIARRGGGGLVTALGGLARHHDVTWVSHVMGEGDLAMRDSVQGRRFEEHARGGGRYDLRLVGELDAAFERYYHTIANPLLWFLHHRLYGFGWDPTIDRATHAAWGSYRAVNERIAAALVEELEDAGRSDSPTPFVMVHDYHLFLVPGIVREQIDARSHCDLPFMQFFLHIPWPDPGAWRALPRAWAREVCESLLACEVVGFQTHRDAENFLRTVHHFLGASVEFRTGIVRYMGSLTRVRTYPISVAVDEFAEHAQSATVARLRSRIADMRPAAEDSKLIVRVDRTDPSKNIVRGFRAYGLLLREHPSLHGRVAMFCQLDPSRQDIAEYVDYLAQVKQAANDINQQFATETWTPLHVNLDANFQAAVAAYKEYDVLFVNPVADGMNLVSKEGPLVNERDGVVVLSDQAGSYNELGPYVVPANPFDISQQADALLEALRMPLPERSERARAMREQVVGNDVIEWMQRQLDDVLVLRDGSSGATT